MRKFAGIELERWQVESICENRSIEEIREYLEKKWRKEEVEIFIKFVKKDRKI